MNPSLSQPDYKSLARAARLKVLEMIYKGQSSHIGSNFSCIDILTVLFEKMDLEKDELVVSKGWVAASVYYFLAQKGIIPKEDLERYCQDGEQEYIGLIEPRGKFGLKAAGGSMGFGLPFAVGFALAKKLKGEEGAVYCLMSDGELAIGTTWESALIATQYKLDNLVVIVDINGLQAMGETKSILTAQFPAVWRAMSIDGHNYVELKDALKFAQEDKFNSHLPYLINTTTIKGKGVSFMENNNLYHYKTLTQGEFEEAKKELV